MRLLRLIASLVLGFACLAARADAQALGPAHVKAQLVAETRGATPGAVLYVGLDQRIDAGWHTYWRNPGDAGQATQIRWTLPAGWRAGEIVWPTPERLPLQQLMNYGYRGEVLLPVPIEVPADARPGGTVAIQAAVSFLVCSDVCVPQDATVSLSLPVVAGAAPPDPVWAPRIAAALAAAPKPAGLAASFQSAGGKLTIAAAGPALAGRDLAGAYFYPYQAGIIDQAAAQAIERGPNGASFTIPLPSTAGQGPAPALIEGVIATNGGAFEVSARPGPPPPGSSGLGPPAAAAAPMTLVAALGLAFLGGLILNLMPCVLPVLSMKAAAFAGHVGEARAARIEGLAFAAGVMATFLILAALLIGARAGGEAVGWGFQLQSPQIAGALGLVMLAAALNLSGLYEIGTSIQGLGGGMGARGGAVGAAFTGALAAVAASPCTAPFMGAALGYALTQPPAVALAVFAALAAGFALPFTALGFSPALMRRLPRPGPWMTTLRQALAFPMYGAALWLAWVVAQQAGQAGLARVFAGGLCLAAGAWLWGRAQQRQAVGKGWRGLTATAAAGLALAILAVAGARTAAPAEAEATSGAAVIPSQPYDPARLAALRAAHRPVLVNFTAAWCVTCQVNEKVALNTRQTADALRRTGAVYMVGDWTRRDAVIAKALAEQGRIGVPLYLVYGADGGPPKVLPQLLTPGLVAAALDEAAAGGITPPAAAGR